MRAKFYDYYEPSELKGSARDEYISQIRVGMNDAMMNEIKRALNDKVEKLVRKTACDTEMSFERGGLGALEGLLARLEMLTAEKQMRKRR